jgi:hypothetical protein
LPEIILASPACIGRGSQNYPLLIGSSGGFPNSSFEAQCVKDVIPLYNCQTMSNGETPIIEPEFPTPAEAEAYERWFRAKIRSSLDDLRPSIPHEQVMSNMRDAIEEKRRAHASDPLAR